MSDKNVETGSSNAFVDLTESPRDDAESLGANLTPEVNVESVALKNGEKSQISDHADDRTKGSAGETPDTAKNPPESSTTDAADISKRKKATAKKISRETISNQVDCVNPHCESGVGLTDAPVFVLTYFGLRRRRNTLQKVCDACYLLVEAHYVSLYSMVKNGEPLLRADFPKFKDDVVIMDKVEEIAEELPMDPQIVAMVEDNLNSAIASVIKDCKLDFQIDEASYILNEKMKELELSSEKLVKEFKEIEDQLKKNRKAIYDPFAPTYKHLQPLDLNSKHEVFEKLPPLSRSAIPIAKSKTLQSYVLPPEIVLPSDQDLTTDVVRLAEFNVKQKIKPVAPLKRPPLVVGSLVYAMKSTPISTWNKGKVIDVKKESDHIIYHVEVAMEKTSFRKWVPGNCLAYANTSKHGYDIFTRVIAKTCHSALSIEDAFYVGIIAEPQKSLNKFRYLVFFDKGFAQYVKHDDIRPVCFLQTKVEDDIRAENRAFVKTYMQQYPERPMVRLQPGQMVRTELDRKWLASKVAEVDASLVKIIFCNNDRTEWIYRGSTRLKPLYDQLVNRSRSFNSTYLKKRNMPFVEYSVDQCSEGTSGSNSANNANRNVAKKSTSITSNKPPPRPDQKIEYVTKGVVRRMDLSKKIDGPAFKPHTCSSHCVDWTNYQNLNTRRIPPLCIPLMMGFCRLVHKHKMRRSILYRTPCGRVLRNMAELRMYLTMTDCAMGYDLFDFDHWVRVTDEFHLEPYMYKTHIEDISDGSESMVVSCVNEIQDAWPQVMSYSRVRLPQKGVHINTDKEFMVCCDCADDCFDKEKCACWQLTIAGMQQGTEPVDIATLGYSYRRLHDFVTTGIYECHSGCSCVRARCVNRVVQRPLSQRLQVFRTLHKGWGLRTLNDIPSGAFICIYVGRLLTEASANDSGRAYGDEYLAELDYIEVVGQFKDGYEEMVDDPDQDSDYNEDDEEEEVVVKYKRTKHGLRERVTQKNGGDNEEGDRSQSSFTAGVDAAGSKSNKRRPLRELFGETTEDVYIMDAKYQGNIGRYLNHSCTPNVFVQNVFVDTHDVRFPWIAFFALSHIRAGTELTWDYNYLVGSVPEKVLYCYCNSFDCRGRLL